MKIFEMKEAGGPEVLQFGDRDVPTPGPDQVVIEVIYAGLNFTDVLARRGIPGYSTGWPFVPGMEASGIVHAVGSSVQDLSVGDAVLAFTVDGGGFADYVVAEAQLTISIPAEIDFALAAAIPLSWAAAVGVIRAAHVTTGDSVVVTSAAGAVGYAIGALLATEDVGTVIGAVGSAAKSGALHSRYVPVVRGESYADAAKAAAGVETFDVILDSIGGAVLADSVAMIAPGGRLVNYGAAAVESEPPVPAFRELRTRNLDVAGFSIINMARRRPAIVHGLLRDVADRVRAGLVIPRPDIISWHELESAHLEQSNGSAVGKTVVAVNPTNGTA
jgi:NADPH:quinone reductase